MILCVCLNAALDVTYHVPHLALGSEHRATRVHEQAGGKGINVARVLRQLGEHALVMGFAGGATGAAIGSDLSRAGIEADLITIAASSRRTVAMVDGAGATVVNEAGPCIDSDEWQAFVSRFSGRAAQADVVVVSGSVPPGVPLDGYRILTEVARNKGAKVMVDASGQVLEAALAAGPDVVKPNATEAAELVGRPVTSVADALEVAAGLRDRGAGAAVVSRGGDGLVAATTQGRFLVGPPAQVNGNPTGAGDALAAVLALGLARDTPWPALLGEAVALSASAVSMPVAGCVDPEAAVRLLPDITVERIR